jgi:hypothetical protein
MAERVDRAAGVQHRRVRRRPVQRDRRKPLAVTLGPRLPVIEPDPVTQQQLRQAMASSHQIHPDRVAGADQVAQRLLLIAGNPDRVQLARQQQPHEMLGVAPIGLHAIPACARDLARRRDHALHAALGELARQAVTRRTGLIRHPHRPRQARTEPGRAVSIAAHPERLQLSRLGVQDRRDDLRRVHVQADESLSLRHGWFLQYAVVGLSRGGYRAA